MKHLLEKQILHSMLVFILLLLIYIIRVSYFELTCEEHVISNKLRSSGLLVYTGTGSTSWYINYIL